ncbi:MAG: YciI family protein [Nocardioides sp.]
MPEYMLSVNHVENEPTPSAEETQRAFEEVDAFNTRLQEAGAWVFAGGLMPRETATTVDNSNGEEIVVDGPFAETKEWLGGFWVIGVPDLDAALRWAHEGSLACAGKVEVRPFQAG